MHSCQQDIVIEFIEQNIELLFDFQSHQSIKLRKININYLNSLFKM